MKTKNRIIIKYTVEDAGWAKCSVEFGNNKIEMDASDVMNDPLSEMVNAAIKILKYKGESDFYLWEEPAEVRWYLKLIQKNIEIKIIRYGDLLSITPNQKGELIFLEEVDLVDFVRAVIRCVDEVVFEEGEEGYSEKWKEHKLPIGNLEILKNELKTFKDNKNRREEEFTG
ncbi:MAG: hypothetical protein JXA91_03330 [Candidatus Thermoplasmatota archaeon]|nr:hypothetical protein [Candidatus Thermoplasmatota archaeon]